MKRKKILILIITLLFCVTILYFSFCYGFLNIKNKSFDDNQKEVIKENITIESNIKDVYLALNGTKKLDIIVNNNTHNKAIIWESKDSNIVNVLDGVISGNSVGTTTVIVSVGDVSYSFNVIVTDLITVPTYDTNKPYLPCKRYTKEEAELLDEILESRINEAGLGTRGGVVAAERFLLLEFPYTIKYFNENGRLADHGAKAHIDAEGRYYHKGLYLNESKFDSLEKGASTKSGPAIWGCNLYDSFLSSYRPNGFTCSGYVTWALLNGGLGVGDVGAGDFADRLDDLSDLGEHQQITYDFMKNGSYKVGDFIARNGHAALVIGIDDNYIYTSEALPPKLKIYKYERYNGIVNDPNLTYIINMDNIYPNGEGIYTNMW